MSSRVAKMMLARSVGERKSNPQNWAGKSYEREDSHWEPDYQVTESRRRDRYGRYARAENWNRGGESKYDRAENEHREAENRYRMGETENGNREMRDDYETHNHYGQEKIGKIQKIGFAQSKQRSGKITEKEAKDIAKKFSCANGERGPHWSYDQLKKLVETHRVECEPEELFLVVNALYCDYCWVMQKYGMDTLDVYIDLAIAWLKDDDAVDDKVTVYFREIAK